MDEWDSAGIELTNEEKMQLQKFCEEMGIGMGTIVSAVRCFEPCQLQKLDEISALANMACE